MQIHHGRIDALMAQQIFDGHNIKTFFQKVRRISVPQSVDAHVLYDARCFGCLLYCPPRYKFSYLYYMKWYYTYLLQSEIDNQFYTGFTIDLENRLSMHNSGKVASTKSRIPFKLVYFEACLNEQDVRARERYLKSGMGKKYLKNRIKSSLEEYL